MPGRSGLQGRGKPRRHGREPGYPGGSGEPAGLRSLRPAGCGPDSPHGPGGQGRPWAALRPRRALVLAAQAGALLAAGQGLWVLAHLQECSCWGCQRQIIQIVIQEPVAELGSACFMPEGPEKPGVPQWGLAPQSPTLLVPSVHSAGVLVASSYGCCVLKLRIYL